MSVFRPEHKPLDQIFAAGSNYRIPAYQRPYSWESRGRSDRDSQVNRMWEDLWDFFQENRESTKEYFLGSMVIIEDPKEIRTFDVIDGQQRLTTLLLLFGAMRCFLDIHKKNGSHELQVWCEDAIRTLDALLYNKKGIGLTPTLKLKLQRKIGTDYNNVLEQCVKCDGVEKVGELPEKSQIVAERYFNNRDYLMKEIVRQFITDGVMDTESQINFDLFFRFLVQRVAIVLITTTDFSTAFRVFEILNNRGLPLSNLDLLRNFALEEFATAGFSDGEMRWEKLESDYDLPEEFVGRFAESKVAANLRGSAFNELQGLYVRVDSEYKKTASKMKIEHFMADLEQNLGYFDCWLHHDAEELDVKIRHALALIKLLGNERYTANLMLALFRRLDYKVGSNPDVLRFLHTYRSYALNIYLRGRYSAESIYKAIKLLNAGKFEEARILLVLPSFDREALSVRIGEPLNNNEAKRLLAAYIWSDSEKTTDVASLSLDFAKATLEHIMPQKPATGTNWLTEFDEEFRQKYTYRLGNMTLLTHTKNSSLRNYGFEKKKVTYAKSVLPLTRDIGAQGALTKNYFVERHQMIVGMLRTLFIDESV